MATISIHHDTQDQAFYAQVDGKTIDAELTYSLPKDDVMDFVHTYVDEEYRNLGIGDKLAEAGLTYARNYDHKVKLSCQFMKVYVRRHPEFEELVVK
jgi:uncharacterized protein